MIILIKAHYKKASKKDIRNLKTLKKSIFKKYVISATKYYLKTLITLQELQIHIYTLFEHIHFFKKYKNLIYDDNKFKLAFLKTLLK